jgi:hypothetical protein
LFLCSRIFTWLSEKSGNGIGFFYLLVKGLLCSWNVTPLIAVVPAWDALFSLILTQTCNVWL